jgi:GTP-binding protein HflX
VALNKIDKVEDPATLAGLRRHFPDAVFISVHTGQGLDELVERMAEFVANGSVTRELLIPQGEGGILAKLHRHARVLETAYEGDSVRMVAVIPARLAETLSPYLIDGGAEKSSERVIFTDKVPATG